MKKIRIGVSLIFFILTFFVFVDFNNALTSAYINSVLYMQFVPSLLKFLSQISFLVIGFLVVIFVTLLYGRIYCSSVCPLGTLQDIITWFSRKATRDKRKKRRFHHFSRPKNTLRYSILIAAIAGAVSGGAFFLSLLDPYSNFGRFTTTFVKPVLIGANNLLSRILENFNLFWIYPVENRDIYWTSFIFPSLMLILVLWLSWKYGRLYCNTVCPVGSFLGILSKYSMFKLTINTKSCNHCGVCVTDCKASCIDSKAQTVDFTRCIGCFNCFKACDKNSFYYRNTWFGGNGEKKAIEENEIQFETPDLGKRGFIAGMVTVGAWLMGFRSKPDGDTLRVEKEIVATKPSTVKIIREHPVTPPGSLKVEHFNSYCTACSLCVSACPTNVLQPSFLEYGLIGMMQPRMDYWSGFCNYECKICSEVCPTEAIKLVDMLKEKQTIQMGIAHFVKDNCIVHTEKTDCGACSENCPTKAVDMVPYEDTGLFIPEVTDEICIGCGACEFACPTIPYKAIYIEGNPVHKIAEEPKKQELNVQSEPEEDFPF